MRSVPPDGSVVSALIMINLGSHTVSVAGGSRTCGVMGSGDIHHRRVVVLTCSIGLINEKRLAVPRMLAKSRSLWFDLDDDSQAQNHEGWRLGHREATN